MAALTLITPLASRLLDVPSDVPELMAACLTWLWPITSPMDINRTTPAPRMTRPVVCDRT